MSKPRSKKTVQDSSSDIGIQIWEAEVKFFKKLSKLLEEKPREAVVSLIRIMKHKLDQIQFGLIDRFELDGIKETELRMETDPLLIFDLYVDSITRHLLWLKQASVYRASEIRELRKRYREGKGE